MKTRSKILVTGGAGFLGSHLCDRLIAAGNDVWCLDNLSTGDLGNLDKLSQNPKFTFLEGDVCCPLPELQFDQIYNLACPASPPHYQSDPIATFKASVLGALNVLEHARRTNARVLQTSTSEVYGDPTVHPQPEHYAGSVSCTGIRACYDEGKRAAETIFYDYHRMHGVEIRVARLFNAYGPRMGPSDGRVIPNFLEQALQDLPLTVYGAGTQTRSFCFVSDTVDGLVRLMNLSGGRVGPINIGNPTEYTVRELADKILQLTGSSSTITFKPLPEDDPKLRRPDTRMAKEVLGWEPNISLDEGLRRTIAEWPKVTATLLEEGSSSVAGDRKSIAIIGGGPAGLTAAYWALRHQQGLSAVVFESSDKVGGIARTEAYRGNRFDIGGHRFFTKVEQIERLWKEAIGDQFLRRPRLSRIYYNGKYYAYPIKLFNALGNLGIYESARILLSYAKWRVRPYKVEENFDQWVTNRFGGRLFWHFFKTYTEKVWGMPCSEIKADWAAQRIKNLSLRTAVLNAITGANDTSSLIEEFDYPRLGPGMMWEAFRDKIEEAGGEVRMSSNVVRVHHDSDQVLEIELEDHTGQSYRHKADYYINSMPITQLVRSMVPLPPERILEAAEKLKYRDFLIVTLILDKSDPFPDNWIYIHSPEAKVGRIQNFRSWSEDLLADPKTSSIGMEYFCNVGDEIWNMEDQDLVKFAAQELEGLGLAKAENVLDGAVIRQPLAYPVYDGDYREALDLIRGWLAGFKNLQTVGRNGMHRYNNQDHSMMTAMLAVNNILGEDHDLWSVNVDQSYHEDVESAPGIMITETSAS